MNYDLTEIRQRLQAGVRRLKNNERNKRRYRENGGAITKMRANLKAEYGMSLETYYQLRSEQLGRCAICNRYENQINHNSQKLVVDHDHDTQKVRGLLCHRCNAGLGAFRDNLELLGKAMRYLLGHHRVRVRLTMEQKMAIRSDGRSSRKIAEDYGVSHEHVRRIRQAA